MLDSRIQGTDGKSQSVNVKEAFESSIHFTVGLDYNIILRKYGCFI